MPIQTMSRIQVSCGRDFIWRKQRPAPRNKRGAWLVVLELTFFRLAWTFNLDWTVGGLASGQDLKQAVLREVMAQVKASQ